MSNINQNKQTLAERLIAFLGRYRRALLVSGSVVVAGILLAVVLFQVYETRMERAARQAELLLDEWSEWQSLEDRENTDRIRSRAESLIEDFPRSYGALRALQVMAQLEWELENFAEARDYALRLVDSFSDSHLTGTALANAAAASEELGETEAAREYLERLADGEGAPSAERARALFNLGRLAEVSGTPSEALGYYNRLVDNHPESNWTNLGRNRIIWLTSQGTDADT